jgi:hypothetical protein
MSSVKSFITLKARRPTRFIEEKRLHTYNIAEPMLSIASALAARNGPMPVIMTRN